MITYHRDYKIFYNNIDARRSPFIETEFVQRLYEVMGAATFSFCNKVMREAFITNGFASIELHEYKFIGNNVYEFRGLVTDASTATKAVYIWYNTRTGSFRKGYT